MTHPADYEGEERRQVNCDNCKVNPEWVKEFPEMQKQLARDQGGKNIVRWGVSALIGFTVLAVFTFKADMEGKNAVFKDEMTARQREHAQQMKDRQDSAEQANLARNAVFSVQIESISNKVGEMTTQTAIIAKLFEQSQKQEITDRERTEQVVKRLEERILIQAERSKK